MRKTKIPVRLSVDNFEKAWPRAYKKARLGALLHPASVNGNLCHTLEILKSLDDNLFRLKALFGPQHGFLGETQDNMIEWQSHDEKTTGIPLYSLYSDQREPTAEMLAGLDALFIDLQDVGARYYTFIWSLYLCMRACEKHNVAVVVLDRPNPLNGITVEGPKLDTGFRSFVGLHPIPVRHGKTIGQLALQFKNEIFTQCELTVLPMEGWSPEMWFDETGLFWVPPSPNMPTLNTAIVYPGLCLLEGTNISEGRGTTRPFEFFGAPFIDNLELSSSLNKKNLPGVKFRAASFVPMFHKFSGQLCFGAQIHVTDRQSFLPFLTGVEIIKQIKNDYPDDFSWKQPPYEYEYEKLPIEVLTGGPVSVTFPN